MAPYAAFQRLSCLLHVHGEHKERNETVLYHTVLLCCSCSCCIVSLILLDPLHECTRPKTFEWCWERSPVSGLAKRWASPVFRILRCGRLGVVGRSICRVVRSRTFVLRDVLFDPTSECGGSHAVGRRQCHAVHRKDFGAISHFETHARKHAIRKPKML